VISLSAKGLTHGEIAAHLAEVYGAEVSKQTITTITDAVMEGMAEWQSRPLDPVYAVVFIDAINVKIREGQIANRPIYLALGVTVDGERDILGLWAGEHGAGEGAKYWLRVLSEIKNRGVRDVCLLVCDGLKGLPDAVSAVWEKTIVQTCIVHLLRNSFKYASKRDWAQLAKDLKPIYTAASEAEALDRFAEFSGKWENSPGPGLTTSRRRARNVETGRRRWAYRLRIIVVSPWLAELARLPGVGMRHLARDERADLAAFLTTLPPEQWQAPTLCARWRVRDVVAHVVSYDELDMYGLLAKAVRGRFWSRRVNALAMAPYRTRSPEQLLALLTAHLQPRGLPAALGGRVALTEGLIHHQDIRRALGAPRAIPPERLLPVLRIALIAPDIGGLWHYRGLRLVATDLGFSAGIGSEVRGTAEALLMTMAGRRGVVSELSGPGQPKLARHLDR